MKTIIYEDRADEFSPLTLLNPQYGMRIGLATVAEQLIAYCGSTRVEYVAREYLQRDKISAQGPLTYVAASFIPSATVPSSKHDIKFVNGDRVVGLVRHKPPFPVTLGEIEDALEHTRDARQVQGSVLEHMWDIIAQSGDLITSQFKKKRTRRASRQVYIIGNRQHVHVAPSARLHRHTVIDATDGPVYIDARAEIRPFSSIVGPAYIGQDTIVDRAKIIRSSIGPMCRIGGEVEACVFQGYANKYHEGFIGHSFIGEWVNLGALTTNSDLKNNYGPVRLEICGRTVDTAMTKLGCFIGDHTKTGIGTLIPTGAIIGCFVNFFGGGMMPRNVPSFRWLSSQAHADHDLEKAILTARYVMKRRGVTMSPQQESVIRYIHECRTS
jgi:UDP-N-acetylglucosamine diphosphorylase/glucosamine-1-phosphate N-acetyltransferase